MPGSASQFSACANPCAFRAGDLWKVTLPTVNPIAQVTEYLAYDGAGRPLSVKDANGVVTDYVYSSRGWLTDTKVRTGTGQSVDDANTAMAYDSVGQVTRITPPDGNYTDFTYDAAHRLTRVTDRLGHYVEYTLDAMGNRIEEKTKTSAGTTKREIDRLINSTGQLESLIRERSDTDGIVTDFTYDANGALDVTRVLPRFRGRLS